MKKEKVLYIHSVDEESKVIHFHIEEVVVVPEDLERDILSKMVSERKYIPTAGDRIWIYPNANIPRFKLKQFCKDYKVALVKEKSKANARFVGPDHAQKVTSFGCNYYKFETPRILAWMRESVGKSKMNFVNGSSKSEERYTLKEFINLLETSGLSEIYIERYEISSFSSDPLNKGDHLLTKNAFMSEETYNEFEAPTFLLIQAATEYEDDFNEILTDPLVYHQNDLLSKLSGAVMNEEMYTRVGEMLKSSDTESQKLAIESMASCDFQKSGVYLLLLLYTNSDEIQEIPSKHHSNFKSLLKFFNLRSAKDVRSLDNIIECLKHQKLFNLTNLNILMPLALEHIKEHGSMDNILVKDVELSPEAEAALAENILDSAVDIVDEPKETVLGEL